MEQKSINELTKIVTTWALECGYDIIKMTKIAPTFNNFAGNKNDLHIVIDFNTSLPKNQITELMIDHKDEWETVLSQEVDFPTHLYFNIPDSFIGIEKDKKESGIILFDLKEHQKNVEEL